MVNKETQQNLERELIDSFKVLYSDIYSHEKLEKFEEEVKKYIVDIKELVSICDDVSLKVKLVCTMPDGTEKHTKYQDIQQFTKAGFDLIEDIETIQVCVKGVIKKGEMVMESSDKTPFFKSEVFLLEENIKSKIAKLRMDSINQGKSKDQLISRQNLQEWSNNRIRFPENQTLEV